MSAAASQPLILRRLTVDDNPAIASVIRRVSAEYGLTADKGYTVADPNLDELYELYSQPGPLIGSLSRMAKWSAAAAWRRFRVASPISVSCRKCTL